MTTAIHWFRRDLRLGDNPALLAARDAADDVLGVFVLDDSLCRPSGTPRLAFLYRCLRALDDQMDGHLVVRHGKPENVLPTLVRETAATQVHLAADYGPYGRERDARVDEALDTGVELVRTGSAYAVAPGRVTKDDGEPYKVFTPFSRAWRAHGWRAPAATPRTVAWRSDVDSPEIPADPQLPTDVEPPVAGERAARDRWRHFRDHDLERYDTKRNDPGADATSRMSAYLKWGCVHPRTLLADLVDRNGTGVDTYRTELAWREFYADVLWRRPDSAREYYQPRMARMPYDSGPGADEHLRAWQEGRTGYPIVDAGMRQLLREGWMHNRVRMIVASFLVKDLHLEWTAGARHFMRHLVDGDLASNQHGWQWTAGSGTDAAPYFRVFNPVTQAQRYDPDGAYVRRWVTELSDVAGAGVHAPWELPAGLPNGYPARIVDHAEERVEALRRYETVR